MEDIMHIKRQGYSIIKFNRPRKKNALTSSMLVKFQDYLQEAATDESIMMVVVTGTGDYFTSGNDLNNFTQSSQSEDDDMNSKVKAGRDGFHKFVKTIIDFPKILAAVINGPSVGIGVTMLGLFDLVYASDRATFYTPFAGLGQAPEGCSSYIFPKIMGYGKAAEMLIFGRKMSSSEAYICGLVTQVFPHNNLSEAWDILEKYANFDAKAVMVCKNIMRYHEKSRLHKVNDDECDTLQKCWTSDEFLTAMMKFFSNRSKL